MIGCLDLNKLSNWWRNFADCSYSKNNGMKGKACKLYSHNSMGRIDPDRGQSMGYSRLDWKGSSELYC